MGASSLLSLFSFVALVFHGAVALSIVQRPTLLYSSVSPKLRIQTEASEFNSESSNIVVFYFMSTAGLCCTPFVFFFHICVNTIFFWGGGRMLIAYVVGCSRHFLVIQFEFGANPLNRCTNRCFRKRDRIKVYTKLEVFLLQSEHCIG